MSGKLQKKNKSFQPIGHLKQHDRLFNVKSFAGYENLSPKNSSIQIQTQFCRKTWQKQNNQVIVTDQELDNFNVDELRRDLFEKSESDRKENKRLPMEGYDTTKPPFFDVSDYYLLIQVC